MYSTTNTHFYWTAVQPPRGGALCHQTPNGRTLDRTGAEHRAIGSSPFGFFVTTPMQVFEDEHSQGHQPLHFPLISLMLRVGRVATPKDSPTPMACSLLGQDQPSKSSTPPMALPSFTFRQEEQSIAYQVLPEE